MTLLAAAEEAAALSRGAPLPRVRRLPADLRVIPDAVRCMGASVWAAKGAGKSHLLGRVIAWQDFLRGVPLVVLDPIGGTIDHVLDKIYRRPHRERAQLWTRVRYVNMSGSGPDGRVVPWPIYYQAYEGERLSSSARRYLDLLIRADPELSRAPIQGLNAVTPLAHAAGVVLMALGLGITEAWSLVSEPGRWEVRLTRLVSDCPETAGAVAELRALYGLPPREREMRTATFKSKLSLFRFAPNFRAIFGAQEPGINWSEVVKSRQAVLLDFRDIQSPAEKKLCLLWVYQSLVTFIKQRGYGRHTPVSFIVDELSYLVGTAAVNTDLLTADLDELIHRISRSHRVWLTIAGQELFQLPEQLRSTVLSTGVVLFGQTSDYKTAEELARRFFRYRPDWVRKREPIQGVVRPGYPGMATEYGIVGERTTEFSRDDQNYLHSRAFLQLPAFHFLLGVSEAEGQLPSQLQRITTAHLDRGLFPDKRIVERLRSELMHRDGVSEQELLTEIACRLADAAPPRRGQTASGHEPPQPEAPRVDEPAQTVQPPEGTSPDSQLLSSLPIGRYHPDERESTG